jgi:hypothetical protein
VSRPYIICPQISLGAAEELAAHGVTEDEALDVVWANPKFFEDKVEGRMQMIGKTRGNRILTIVIEPTDEFGVYDLITGWDSSVGEQAAWRNAK